MQTQMSRFVNEQSDDSENQELLSALTCVRLGSIGDFAIYDRLTQLNILLVGKNFQKNFNHRFEEELNNDSLSINRLNKDSLDGPIFGDLSDRPETTISHIFELISRQRRGQKGLLATNGYSNVAYVRYDSILWTIQFRWLAHNNNCWRIEAHHFNHRHGWRSGCRILSRNYNI